MNEIEIFKEALSEYREAYRLRRLNEQLTVHLYDSLFYLLKYSEKNNLPLPNKSSLIQVMQNTDKIIDLFSSEKVNPAVQGQKAVNSPQE